MKYRNKQNMIKLIHALALVASVDRDYNLGDWVFEIDINA
jgi:hypothetical protein